MISGYIDKKSRTIEKGRLLQDGKEDILKEVIAEEKEIADLLQQIIYWAHQGGFKDMTCHQIVTLTRQILLLLQIEDKKLHSLIDEHQHKGFDRVHSTIDRSEHIVKIAQMHESKMNSAIKDIMSAVSDYKEDKIPPVEFSDRITSICNDLVRMIGLDESHLETAHLLVSEHREADKRDRLKRFRNIKR